MPRELASDVHYGEEYEQDIPAAFDRDDVFLRHVGSAVLIYLSSLGKSKQAEIVSQFDRDKYSSKTCLSSSPQISDARFSMSSLSSTFCPSS